MGSTDAELRSVLDDLLDERNALTKSFSAARWPPRGSVPETDGSGSRRTNQTDLRERVQIAEPI